MAQKETILGNYTNFPRFPLDCESMEYIQENIKHLAIVAQIAGCDKLIIKGCTGNSQSRTEGYVYVRTGDDLVGEILYYPGGSGVRCGISTENINATANNETFTSAYTIRKLVSGTTGEWSWSDFRALSEITNSALKTLVDGKAAEGHNHDAVYSKLGHNHDTAYAAKSHTHAIIEVSGLQTALKTAVNETLNSAKAYTDQEMTLPSVAFVRGMIMMWSGAANEIPSGWALCNGSNGTPPLQDRFIVGAGGEYNVGAQSGVKTQSITLTVNNMPSHNHTGTTTYDGAHTHAISHKGYYDCKGDNKRCMSFDTIPNDPTTYSFTCSSGGGHSHTFTTNDSGNGSPITFDNRPPYYALCFIMKL